MAATSWDPNQPRVAQQHGACVPKIQYGILEDDSKSFKAGCLVDLTSGACDSIDTDAVAIYGIAQKDSTNTSSGNIEIPIQPIYPTDELYMRVRSGASDALANTASPGTAYGIIVDASTDVAYMDTADTSNDCVVFQGELLDSTGASTYWARVHLLDTAAQAVSE